MTRVSIGFIVRQTKFFDQSYWTATKQRFKNRILMWVVFRDYFCEGLLPSIAD
jgi:hypothetical protein